MSVPNALKAHTIPMDNASQSVHSVEPTIIELVPVSPVSMGTTFKALLVFYPPQQEQLKIVEILQMVFVSNVRKDT